MRCYWASPTKGSKCVYCGKELSRDYDKPPISDCSAPKCIHLGKPRDTVLIKCETCRGNVRLKYTVFNCNQFDECLTETPAGVTDLMVCPCPSYESYDGGI